MPTAVPLPRNARVEILAAGYLGEGDHVGSTVSFVEEGTLRAIIDPGFVRSRATILGSLRRLGVRPTEITDVILSHHHPDHTVNCALFRSPVPTHK